MTRSLPYYPNSIDDCEIKDAVIQNVVRQKNIGFLNSSRGKIFFHINNLYVPLCNGGDTPEWKAVDEIEDQIINYFFSAPICVLKTGKNEKGLFAIGAVFSVHQFEQAHREIENRSNYRIVVRTGSRPPGKLYYAENYKYEVLRVTKNLDLFRLGYRWLNVQDPKKVKAGTVHYFEKEEDGNWVLCDDPR